MVPCEVVLPWGLRVALLMLATQTAGVVMDESLDEYGGWMVGRPQPYFADMQTNFTLISGNTAYLPCRVHLLGDRQVTWMRRRDLHILTVGLVTYTADDRFQVFHTPQTDDWTLQIQSSQARDSGAYTCQVNSDPKIFIHMYLKVTDKKYFDSQLFKMSESGYDKGYGTHIIGEPERYLQEGSSLSLVCVVSHARKAPTAILWYHNNRVLDYDSPRGGISLQVEKSSQQTSSRLLLSAVTEVDTGNFTCVPVNAPSATVVIHIDQHEPGAAVHHQEVGNAAPTTTLATIPVLTLLLLLLLLRITRYPL
ncbi:unnamed protein product [Meganyctiphanes norvegica]|uniref:Ig-like domain-containing protein n=1 Tax=Meganyctiphanes norvegica TaxID=48144 RepID=A0AAV2QNT6_MEGNR